MKKLSALSVLFFTGFFLFAAERLIVNNVEVKDFKNLTDILGDGTAVFDPESLTLTLNKATVTKGADGKGLKYAEFPAILFEGNLIIVLKGKNIISVGSDCLVMGEKLHNNAIVGSGTLSVCMTGKNSGGTLIKALTWSKGLSKETKKFVKIVVN